MYNYLTKINVFGELFYSCIYCLILLLLLFLTMFLSLDDSFFRKT